jgi:hypothetical protein
MVCFGAQAVPRPARVRAELPALPSLRLPAHTPNTTTRHRRRTLPTAPPPADATTTRPFDTADAMEVQIGWAASPVMLTLRLMTVIP